MSRFIVHAKSDTGQVRQKNEDNVYTHCDDEYCLLIVCDGMGGHEAGEEASRIAVQILVRSLSRESPYNLYADLMLQALKKADQRVYEQSIRLNTPSMGTTASVVLQRNNMLYVGWVGDSRIYLFRRDGNQYFQYLKTADHNNKTTAEKNNLPPPKGKGNALNQAIGGGVQGVEPSTYRGFSFQQGDLILICSDGLTDMVCDQQIKQIIHEVPFDQLVEHLVDAANEQEGKDNISVVAMGDYTTQTFVKRARPRKKK